MTQMTARDGRGRPQLRTLSWVLCISLMGLGGAAFAEPAKTSNVKRAPRAAAQQATSSTVVHRTSLGTEQSTQSEPYEPTAQPSNDGSSGLSGVSGLSSLSGLASTKQTKETKQTRETVKLDTSFGHLPLSFERNDGQADDTVQFLARGKGAREMRSAT